MSSQTNFQVKRPLCRASLADINVQEKRLYGVNKNKWDGNYGRIRKIPMLKNDRQKVMNDFAARTWIASEIL
jgi:hypothetical protein